MDFKCIYELYAEEYGITYQEAKDMVDAMWAEMPTEKKLYRHKKTGKLYSLVSSNFLFKDFDESMDGYEWRRGLILYKAEYNNTDGPFFARCPNDFYAQFEPVTNE